MLGTIVNSLAILLGGIVGIVIKGNLPEKFKDIIMKAVGLSVLFLGLNSVLSNINNAKPILFIISLVVGSIVGEFFDIDNKINKFGVLLEKKFKGNGNIAKGFVTSTLLFCVGTMAILGSIESGLMHKHDILFAKSILDGISSIIFASTLGIGVLLSSVSVFIYQGSLTLLAALISNLISEQMLAKILVEISVVGGVLITSLALNLLGIMKIKTANMLPAIIVPVIYLLTVK